VRIRGQTYSIQRNGKRTARLNASGFFGMVDNRLMVLSDREDQYRCMDGIFIIEEWPIID
jgi:hypothetical protein